MTYVTTRRYDWRRLYRGSTEREFRDEAEAREALRAYGFNPYSEYGGEVWRKSLFERGEYVGHAKAYIS